MLVVLTSAVVWCRTSASRPICSNHSTRKGYNVPFVAQNTKYLNEGRAAEIGIWLHSLHVLRNNNKH